MGLVLVAGGTGFLGTTLVQHLLREQQNVVVLSRITSPERINERLASNGTDRNLLAEALRRSALEFLSGVDLTWNECGDPGFWRQRFDGAHIDLTRIDSIVNLTGQTDGTSKEIYDANVLSARHLLVLVRSIKRSNPDLMFIHMGSVSEKVCSSAPAAYALAKRQAIRLLKNGDACDYHVLAGFVKGRGERKVTLAAPRLLKYVYLFPNWFHGFKVAVVDESDMNTQNALRFFSRKTKKRLEIYSIDINDFETAEDEKQQKTTESE